MRGKIEVRHPSTAELLLRMRFQIDDDIQVGDYIPLSIPFPRRQYFVCTVTRRQLQPGGKSWVLQVKPRNELVDSTSFFRTVVSENGGEVELDIMAFDELSV